MTLTSVTIGGVPEHFNLPVHNAIANGDFQKAGVEVHWMDFPGGTGDMKEALRQGTADMCILLTEGIVADILTGNLSKIVSGYVNTPLTWGIHTHTDFPAATVSANLQDTLFSRTFAISRLGSGSHLIPIVHAMMNEQRINPGQFKEISNLKGAIESLNKGETEIFYWEKYTTKPVLKASNMKRIGEFSPPWPCFVIAATNAIIDRSPEVISATLKVIQRSCAVFMQSGTAVEQVVDAYQIDRKDAERWYHATEWATNGWVSNKMLESVLYSLKEAEVISDDKTAEGIIWERHKKN